MIPAGWKLVPIEPTDEMLCAWSVFDWREGYKRMIAAAPTSLIAEPLNRHAAAAKRDDFMEVTRARTDIIKLYRDMEARYEACHEAHVNTENDLAHVREECQRLRVAQMALAGKCGECPYCTIPGMDCYYSQTCRGCVKRMGDTYPNKVAEI